MPIANGLPQNALCNGPQQKGFPTLQNGRIRGIVSRQKGCRVVPKRIACAGRTNLSHKMPRHRPGRAWWGPDLRRGQRLWCFAGRFPALRSVWVRCVVGWRSFGITLVAVVWLGSRLGPLVGDQAGGDADLAGNVGTWLLEGIPCLDCEGLNK